MNVEFYEELMDLVEIYDNCSSNGKKMICFRLVKEIVDGKVLKENISEKQKELAREQLIEVFDWFQSIGATIKFQEEFRKILD